MEVADSHMSEHFSAHTPAHVDVDMSAEYDDDAEYAMHDVTEATTTTNDTNDEEIYDAEFEEVHEHTEIEMDEYADEVEVEDDETHMGSYVPTDDAATVTDVTVEDVQLRSSPVPAGIPQASATPTISPHVSVDADLPLNEAPTGALADHSPHSVATLVGDSEDEHPQVDTSKDGALNEVIDLTENDEEPQNVTIDAAEETTSTNPTNHIDQALPQSEPEITQDEVDETEQEFYDTEEPATELPPTDPTAPDQSTEQQEDQLHEEYQQDVEHTDHHEIVEAPTHLEIHEQAGQDGHSPIEEALVLNQQVRDDAADSMEPSPPVRLYYRDANTGANETFDIFAPTGLESGEAVLLFHDNRTLFYEPLSAFFAKLRETEFFSGDGWEGAEMGVRMDLGDSSISINEDHKDTENISLFKLSFIWSGFGLEEPLELTLVRLPERFAVQLARLVEQVEQRDFHHGDAAEPPAVHHEAETGGSEINSDDIENDEGDGSESAPPDNTSQQGEHGALTNPNEVSGDAPRDARENADAQVPNAVHPEGLDERQQGVNGDDRVETTGEIGADRGLKDTVQDITTHDTVPTTQPENLDDQGTEAEGTGLSPEDDDDHTVSHGQSPSTPTLKPQEEEYDEYEAAEGVNDSAPTQAPTQTEAPNVGWDANEYDYEEDYEGADEEHGKRMPPDNNPNEPTDSDRPPPHSSVPKLQGHDSLQNISLKRHLDELEYEEYETPSAPSSPGSEYKRVKHV